MMNRVKGKIQIIYNLAGKRFAFNLVTEGKECTQICEQIANENKVDFAEYVDGFSCKGTIYFL